jgi:hypothetical protein
MRPATFSLARRAAFLSAFLFVKRQSVFAVLDLSL